MANLSHIRYNRDLRNDLPELMDAPDIDPDALKAAVEDINKVNNLLGGYRFTLKAIKNIINKSTNKNLNIVDLGCSNGSMLRYLHDHLDNSEIQFLGIDLSEQSIDNARNLSKGYDRVRFRESDILDLTAQDIKCDILISTLTFHHFTDTQIIEFLKKAKELGAQHIIINDLHRHYLAFVFFKYLSPIFIKNYISRHDGLISIASGFKKSDFRKYAQEAKCTSYRLNWKWSFRYVWLISLE
ncbi:MAG: methyltransferase domain-containing protein [Bacteroidota bacterium]|nr:methyltransferase domain-containing protein [Bacteroidota bacterium]